ncbi:MAG: hypothetical protein ACI31S_02870 [Bacilli bacterium]
MELYSFDQRELEKDYNILLELYLNEAKEDKKIKLYSQILPLRSYLKSSKSPICPAPQEYLDKINSEIEKMKSIYKNNTELTKELCYYWCHSLREVPSSNKFKASKELLTKEAYFEDMKTFFTKVLPSDIDLYLNAFKNGNILVKKSIFRDRAEILYLEDLNKFYIKILYCLNLSKVNARNTIHEIGHASECNSSGSNNSYDYIMDEVIAILYELLYINYSFNSDNSVLLSEFYNLFKIISLSPLENYIISNTCEKKSSTEDFFLGEIRFLYSNIIALSLYLRSEEDDFLEKIEYIKKKKPFVPAFTLLASVGITEKELIYTAKNAKKLIKRG